jgi:hypothetical protein
MIGDEEMIAVLSIAMIGLALAVLAILFGIRQMVVVGK